MSIYDGVKLHSYVKEVEVPKRNNNSSELKKPFEPYKVLLTSKTILAGKSVIKNNLAKNFKTMFTKAKSS